MTRIEAQEYQIFVKDTLNHTDREQAEVEIFFHLHNKLERDGAS